MAIGSSRAADSRLDAVARAGLLCRQAARQLQQLQLERQLCLQLQGTTPGIQPPCHCRHHSKAHSPPPCCLHVSSAGRRPPSPPSRPRPRCLQRRGGGARVCGEPPRRAGRPGGRRCRPDGLLRAGEASDTCWFLLACQVVVMRQLQGVTGQHQAQQSPDCDAHWHARLGSELGAMHRQPLRACSPLPSGRAHLLRCQLAVQGLAPDPAAVMPGSRLSCPPTEC